MVTVWTGFDRCPLIAQRAQASITWLTHTADNRLFGAAWIGAVEWAAAGVHNSTMMLGMMDRVDLLLLMSGMVRRVPRRRASSSDLVIHPSTPHSTANPLDTIMAAAVTPEQIEAKLAAALGATHVQATDLSDGCGAKFEVVVVTPVFEGKALLARHREVNAALAEELKSIHAITLKCMTPAQWEEKQKQQQA